MTVITKLNTVDAACLTPESLRLLPTIGTTQGGKKFSFVKGEQNYQVADVLLAVL